MCGTATKLPGRLLWRGPRAFIKCSNQRTRLPGDEVDATTSCGLYPTTILSASVAGGIWRLRQPDCLFSLKYGSTFCQGIVHTPWPLDCNVLGGSNFFQAWLCSRFMVDLLMAEVALNATCGLCTWQGW